MAKSTSKGGRWYDRYDNISALVSMAEYLPNTVQQDIGANLLTSIDSYRDRMHTHTELRSLGAEVVLGLYKAKKRRRWYDEVPQLSHAINNMSMLPPNVLVRIDGQCKGVVEYMRTHRLGRTFNPAQFAQTIENHLGQSLSVEIREESAMLTPHQQE